MMGLLLNSNKMADTHYTKVCISLSEASLISYHNCSTYTVYYSIPRYVYDTHAPAPILINEVLLLIIYIQLY